MTAVRDRRDPLPIGRSPAQLRHGQPARIAARVLRVGLVARPRPLPSRPRRLIVDELAVQRLRLHACDVEVAPESIRRQISVPGVEVDGIRHGRPVDRPVDVRGLPERRDRDCDRSAVPGFSAACAGAEREASAARTRAPADMCRQPEATWTRRGRASSIEWQDLCDSTVSSERCRYAAATCEHRPPARA